MKKIGYILMIVGIIFFVISGLDLISIILSIIEKIFSFNLNVTFFGSFVFRIMIAMIGGLLLLIGGLILNKFEKE